jgi:chromosome segregation ATPase
VVKGDTIVQTIDDTTTEIERVSPDVRTLQASRARLEGTLAQLRAEVVQRQGEIRDLVDELDVLRATKRQVEAATDRARRVRGEIERDAADLRREVRG